MKCLLAPKENSCHGHPQGAQPDTTPPLSLRARFATKQDDLVANMERGIPSDGDSSFDALMRRAAFCMYFEGSFGRFAGLRRNAKVVVDCNGLDADGFTYPSDATIDSSS